MASRTGRVSVRGLPPGAFTFLALAAQPFLGLRAGEVFVIDLTGRCAWSRRRQVPFEDSLRDRLVEGLQLGSIETLGLRDLARLKLAVPRRPFRVIEGGNSRSNAATAAQSECPLRLLE